jgi:hypothetical protein
LTRATYRLTEGERVLVEGEVESFTGWFAASTTVAVAAAEADARRRLMTMLADRVAALALLVETDLALRSATRAPTMAVLERAMIRLARMARRERA